MFTKQHMRQAGMSGRVAMSRRLLSRYLLRGALAVAAVATLLVASVLLGQQAVASADEGSRGLERAPATDARGAEAHS